MQDGASSLSFTCRSHLRWLLHVFFFYKYTPIPPSFFTFFQLFISYSLLYSLLFSVTLFFFPTMTSPYIHTRDGYVVFSASKPPMKMKFWHIFTMVKLKKELMRWLEGEI